MALCFIGLISIRPGPKTGLLTTELVVLPSQSSAFAQRVLSTTRPRTSETKNRHFCTEEDHVQSLSPHVGARQFWQGEKPFSIVVPENVPSELARFVNAIGWVVYPSNWVLLIARTYDSGFPMSILVSPGRSLTAKTFLPSTIFRIADVS